MKCMPFTGPPSSKIILLVLASLLGLSALAVLARTRRAAGAAGQPPRPDASSTAQNGQRPRGHNLALQPEALKLGLRLGRRFREAGREVSVLSATLTLGGESRTVVIRRIRGEAGESLQIALAGGAPYTWDEQGGARRSGGSAGGEDRLMVERLALDSPDQFVLAQTRGASYHTVARRARPDEGGADGYAGSLYDLVRVGEPSREGGGGPTSGWRLYYLNSATGLLEKVVSDEGGDRVEAALSGWVEHAGEFEPSRITWTKQGQTLMELTVTNVSHGPAQ